MSRTAEFCRQKVQSRTFMITRDQMKGSSPGIIHLPDQETTSSTGAKPGLKWFISDDLHTN